MSPVSRWRSWAVLATVAALGLVACTSTGPGSSSGNNGGNGSAADVDACALLTVAEVQQATKVAMKDGVPNKTEDSSFCEWDPQDESLGISVGVSVTTYDDSIWQAFSTAASAVSVSGLGEKAYKNYPHEGDLAIKQGNFEIDVDMLDFSQDQADVDADVLDFAHLVLQRL